MCSVLQSAWSLLATLELVTLRGSLEAVHREGYIASSVSSHDGLGLKLLIRIVASIHRVQWNYLWMCWLLFYSYLQILVGEAVLSLLWEWHTSSEPESFVFAYAGWIDAFILRLHSTFSFTSCQKYIHQHLRLLKATFLPPKYFIFSYIFLQSCQRLRILATWNCMCICDASKPNHATWNLFLRRYINNGPDVDPHE